MSAWRDTLLIASRESRERARSKAFLVSTAITLVLLIGVLVVIAVTEGGPPTYGVGLVGENPDTLSALIDQTALESEATIDFTPFGDREALADALDAGEVDAAVVDGGMILLREDADSLLEQILQAGVFQARLIGELGELGLDNATIGDLLSVGDISVVREGADGDDAEAAAEGIAFAAVVLLFVGITTYGQWVLMGVLEEKATRVVELLVSSTSVRSLLAGKVIGIGILGIAQLLFIILLGISAGTVLDLFELPSGTAATAVWSIVWFVMGFAFYSVLNAAAGSLVSRTEDAQAAATPIMLIALAAYFVTFATVMPNPDGTLARFLSLAPPMAPIAYPARIAFGGVALWELLLALALMAVAIVLVVRLAARIYSGALLAAGGKVKLREAWKAAGELVAHR